MLFLRANGLGTSRAVRIYKTYGSDAVQVISENPDRRATSAASAFAPPIRSRRSSGSCQRALLPDARFTRLQAGGRCRTSAPSRPSGDHHGTERQRGLWRIWRGLGGHRSGGCCLR